MFGFSYRERLHGGFYLLSDPVDERAADLILDIEAPDLGALIRSRTAELRGDVRLEGFADAARGEGRLIVDPEERRASYELSFTGNDGAAYRFRGHKELSWLNFVDSLTLLHGSVYDDLGRETGRAVLRFDVRGDWASLVQSLRVLS